MVFGGRSDVTCLESDATSPFPHATTIAKYLTLWHWIIGASMQDNERFCWLGHAKKPPGTYNFGMHLSPSQNLLPSTGQTDTEKLGIPGHAIHLLQRARAMPVSCGTPFAFLHLVKRKNPPKGRLAKNMFSECTCTLTRNFQLLK